MLDFRTFLIAGFFLVAVVSGCAKPHSFSGVTPAPVLNVAELSLPDTQGENFYFKPDPGGYQIVFFGFTSCPDICPTTLANAAKALDSIGPQSKVIDLAMVTVDPERDNAETLSGYTKTFSDDAIGLRSLDQAELLEVANGFGASYVLEEVDGELEVGHTSSLFLVDDQGDVILVWTFGTPWSDIAADLEALLAGQNPYEDAV